VEEIGRRASEAKCPLPAEEGWVMEKKKRKRKSERKSMDSKYGYVHKKTHGWGGAMGFSN
jgi:hypothetical protein